MRTIRLTVQAIACASAVLSLLVLPQVAFAGTPGTTNAFLIIQIAPRENVFDVIPDRAVTSPMGCSVTAVVRLPITTSNYQAISSSTITAFATGKLVHFWIGSCDSDGTPIASAVWVDV